MADAVFHNIYYNTGKILYFYGLFFRINRKMDVIFIHCSRITRQKIISNATDIDALFSFYFSML